MSTEGVGKRLYEIKVALEQIERELSDTGAPAAALEDFKTTVDHVRLSVWAVLTAERSGEFRGLEPGVLATTIAEFRLTRCAELCRNIVNDLERGAVSRESPQLRFFVEEARAALAAAD